MRRKPFRRTMFVDHRRGVTVLGYEPPEPKLWKAALTAALIVYPSLYLLDVGTMHHQPGWLYALVASVITAILAYQMYTGIGKWGPGKAASTLVTAKDENAIWPLLGQQLPSDFNEDPKKPD